MARTASWLISSVASWTIIGFSASHANAQAYAPAPMAPAPAAATMAPASAPGTAECVPQCRAGFLCVQGQCISSCNPPCAGNEVCANGQCLAQAPGAAPGMAPGAAPGMAPGAAMQPAGATMNLETPAPAPLPAEEAKIKTFSFVPRIGLQLGGSGTWEDSCDGSDCGNYQNSSLDYDMKTAFAIGADFMFKLGDLFRIGPGLLYTNTMDVKPSGDSSSHEMGSTVDVNFVAEVIPRVSPTVWLVPRVQLGVTVLNASGDSAGDLQNTLNGMKATCEATSGITGCDSLNNPHVGVNLGLGFGAMFAVGPTIRLRVDTLYQYYSVSLYSLGASGYNATDSGTASGGRYFLLAGMEI